MDPSSAALAVAVVRSQATHSLLSLCSDLTPLWHKPAQPQATGQVAHQGHDLSWSVPMAQDCVPWGISGTHILEPGCEPTLALHLLFKEEI